MSIQNIEEQQHPFMEIYDFGIEVLWFPAIAAKYPDRLEEIAQKILDEVEEIGSSVIYQHVFPYENEEVIIITSWNKDLDMLSADADLVAYHEVVKEFTAGDAGGPATFLIPVPACQAGSVH